MRPCTFSGRGKCLHFQACTDAGFGTDANSSSCRYIDARPNGTPPPLVINIGDTPTDPVNVSIDPVSTLAEDNYVIKHDPYGYYGKQFLIDVLTGKRISAAPGDPEWVKDIFEANNDGFDENFFEDKFADFERFKFDSVLDKRERTERMYKDLTNSVLDPFRDALKFAKEVIELGGDISIGKFTELGSDSDLLDKDMVKKSTKKYIELVAEVDRKIDVAYRNWEDKEEYDRLNQEANQEYSSLSDTEKHKITRYKESRDNTPWAVKTAEIDEETKTTDDLSVRSVRKSAKGPMVLP